MNIKPLSDRVVVKLVEAEEKTKTGILLTAAAQEKPQVAEVVAVGPGGVVDGKEVYDRIGYKDGAEDGEKREDGRGDLRGDIRVVHHRGKPTVRHLPDKQDKQRHRNSAQRIIKIFIQSLFQRRTPFFLYYSTAFEKKQVSIDFFFAVCYNISRKINYKEI